MQPGPSIGAVVADAAQRQALVTLRELGRAGVPTCAVDSQRNAPGFMSRWTTARALLPDFALDQDGYVTALIDVCSRHSVRALIPCHDGSIEAIRRCWTDVERVVGLALADEPALAMAVDKVSTLSLAEELGLRTMRGALVTDPSDAAAALERTDLPAVVKPVRSRSQAERTPGRRLTSVVATRREDALVAIDAVLERGVGTLVQEWLPGAREALSFFNANGRIWARFAQRADRTCPPLGGNSVLRESIPLPDDVTVPAERLVREMGLEGYSEVEFRRDRDGRAVLMEINPRLSASVEVAVRAGVGFPGLLYAWAAGEPLTEVPGYRVGVWMRWLGGDLSWLMSALRGVPEPDVPSRGAAVRAFVGDCARRTGYDYLQLGDPRPAVAATGGAVQRTRRRVARRIHRASHPVDTEVAVIGAGPYGLAVAAHLAGRGISRHVFGDPMDLWRSHMPAGMYLKSEGFASNISEPRGELTLARFCREQGLEYGHVAVPVALDIFVGYGTWFQEQLVPDVRTERVDLLRRNGSDFELTLSTGESLRARRVVVATGLQGYSNIPEPLAALPRDRMTHTYDYTRPVPEDLVVVGAGQSALEGAALAREAGASVRIVARTLKLAWNSKPGGSARPLHQRLRYPESGLGEGVRQRVYANHPIAFSRLPASQRVRRAYAFLGPAGAWWLRPRIEGRIDTLLQRSVTAATVDDGHVVLRLAGPEHTEEEIAVERVLAGTGYRADLARLEFLDRMLLRDVATLAGTPVLDAGFQASVPGLYFVGYSAAATFGPLMRFVFGTDFAARRLAPHVAAAAR